MALMAALLWSIFPVTLQSQRPRKSTSAPGPQWSAQFKNSAPGVAYVGSRACAECHAGIYESFKKTDMGRSMSQPGQLKLLGSLQGPIKVKQPLADRYYEVGRHGLELYESEYELDASGKEIFRDEHRIDYLIGSGVNGFTCIVRRGDFLFEAPLSYYARTKEWGLSPGYENADYGFNRPIAEDCVACHSGRPQPVKNIEGKFNQPPFLELAVGCENCHGPGALHVAERRQAEPLSGSVDRSIVNPAQLPPWLANNICMNCHQGADVRATMPGKANSDFRPGTPLANTLAIFAVPFSRQAPPTDPLLQHYALMGLSQCYLKSGGKLSCITCHDPHQQPSPLETPAYFRRQCLTCHTEKSCALSPAARHAKTPPDDCAGCHMPKQNLQEISHSSLTDHRIPARPDEPLPEEAFHLTTPQIPDLVYLDAIPKAPPTPVPPQTLLRAYGELMATHPEYRGRYESLLDSFARTKTDDPLIFSALARKNMVEGSSAAAENYFEQAIQFGSTDAFDFEQAATFQVKAGHAQQAIATVTRGLAANPYSPRLYRLLAALYISKKDYNDALRVMRKDLELFPEDTFMRSLLKQAETGNSEGVPDK